MGFLSATVIFVKSFVCGVASAVPGLSGGTFASILGIYEELLLSVSGLFKNFRKRFLFLLICACGAALGMFIASAPIKVFCEKAPRISGVVFIVITLASTVAFVIKNIKVKPGLKSSAFFLCGLAVSAAVSFVLKNYSIKIETPTGYFLSGFPLAAALVLPAVSFSYLLLFFGMYENVLTAVGRLDFAVLVPLALGVAAGTMLTCRILDKALSENRLNVYCFITGFVVASLIDLTLNVLKY